ncbi:hypothetical protein LWI29_022310 [Acer saccharum]|uniref:Uncharacterized protein n=1 Tax=Acer saccharum TaxID=4024 RepID=A0AA39W8P1_ACESA|nr:hypothetical protein LWI29_022310 [Acer saccharum]
MKEVGAPHRLVSSKTKLCARGARPVLSFWKPEVPVVKQKSLNDETLTSPLSIDLHFFSHASLLSRSTSISSLTHLFYLDRPPSLLSRSAAHASHIKGIGSCENQAACQPSKFFKYCVGASA